MEETNNNAAAIIEVVERLGGSTMLDLDLKDDSVKIAVLPEGKTLQSLKPFMDEYLDRPERKEGTATLTTVPDFNTYVQRHMTPESAVFCDDTNKNAPRLLAIFDAHSKKDANWQKHRATYAFPLSDEWSKWTRLQKWLSQADFAAFIEDTIADVIDPASAGEIAKGFAESVGAQLASPARLLELSRGLAVNVDSKLMSKVNLATGEAQLTYTEGHSDEAGAPLKVPGAFVIAIPVFRLGPAYKVPVRLRYRVENKTSVAWSLSLQRIDHVFENAIAEAAKSVAEVTSLPVFRGKPD